MTARSTWRASASRLSLALMLAASGGVLTPLSALAAEAESAREAAVEFAIPAGPLAEALRRYSDVAGVQAVYSSTLVQNARSPGVTGRMTAREALPRLLAGTGLVARYNGRTVTLERARTADAEDGRVLGPVRVQGVEAAPYAGPPQRGEAVAQLGGVRGRQDDEAIGFRPVTAAVAAGSPLALEDIPRSISVLTQDEIQGQDIQTFGDAIRRLPGLTLVERAPSSGSGSAGGGGSVYARGFLINTAQVDGGAPTSLGMIYNGLLDIGAYERVELVRGPNGVFTTMGSPGGSINFVRKRPGTFETLNVSATVGSFNRYQAGVDVSTPSLFGSPVAFRGVASYQDQEFAWERDHRKNWLVYGIADAPLGEAARIELGANYSSIREKGQYHGLLRFRDGPMMAVPFTYNYVPGWTYLNSDTRSLFSRLYVRLLDNWNFEFGFDYGKTTNDSLDLHNSSTNLLSSTRQVFRSCNRTTGVCTPSSNFVDSRSYVRSSENLGVDLRFTGKFTTFGLKHDVYIGGNFVNTVAPSSGENDNRKTIYPPIFTFDDFLKIKDLGPPEFEPFSDFDGSNASSSTLGITLTDTISWRDRIFLTLNASRQDRESSSVSLQRNAVDGTPVNINLNEEFSGVYDMADDWVPSWSLSAKPLRNMTVYGSYAEGTQDQSNNYTLDGTPLQPSTYENAELGVKYGHRNWLLSISGYHLRQNNVGVSIPGTQGRCPPLPTSSCFYAGGATSKSRGIDFQLSGEVLTGLSVQLSYNYNENETISTQAPLVTQAPLAKGSIYATWRPGFWPKATLKFGTTYSGRFYEQGTSNVFDPLTNSIVASIPFRYGQPSYFVYDLGLDYKLASNLGLSLWVENVGDKQYLSTPTGSASFIGAPRNFSLTLRWRPAGSDDGPSRSPTTGFAPFGHPADWYGGFDTGFQAPDDWVAASTGAGAGGSPVTWTFDTEASPTAHFQLGYRLNRHWRVEFEGGYRSTGFGNIGGSRTAPFGVCGMNYEDRGLAPVTSCQNPQGDGDIWDLVFNGLYDFGSERARFRPFVGAGLGLNRASIDFSGRLDGIVDTVYRDYYRRTNNSDFPGVAGGEKVFGEGTNWGVNLQLLAGASFKLTERASLVATYRYNRLAAFDVKTTNLSNYSITYFGPSQILPGSGSPALKSFKGDWDSQSVTIGLRWAFGAR